MVHSIHTVRCVQCITILVHIHVLSLPRKWNYRPSVAFSWCAQSKNNPVHDAVENQQWITLSENAYTNYWTFISSLLPNRQCASGQWDNVEIYRFSCINTRIHSHCDRSEKTQHFGQSRIGQSRIFVGVRREYLSDLWLSTHSYSRDLDLAEWEGVFTWAVH